MRVFYFLSLIGFLAGMAGCAQRLDEVDEKVTDLQKRTAALELKTGAPIGSDRDLLEGQKLADVRSQVAAMRNELTVLAGKVEALEYDNKNLQARMDQVSQQVLLKLNELDKSKSATVQQPAPAAGSGDVDEEFNTALRTYQDGDFEKSQKLFEAYMARHPRSPLASQALYWMGEGLMERKQYKKAIIKFQDLIEKYPKSEKRCDALAKQITCLKELKMQKEAATFIKVRNAECH